MTTSLTDQTPPPMIRAVLGFSWRWFRAFRRTRPFWGGLWMILGGLWLLKFSNLSIGVVIGSGWNGSAAYLLGGSLVMFGVVAWFAPHYKSMVGLIGVGVALAAFISVNLGGFLIGSLLGIVGGSMVWGWGEKKPRVST